MGFMDSLKVKLAPARNKVSDFALQHGDTIEHRLDKAARAVDAKTKGRYSSKIESGTGKAKDALDRIAHKADTAHKDDGTTPPPA
ncbi:antitoxin [Streptomyces sp. NBC_01481]|uniref:antitoxin n=1 Tax=Streptomyces sp. NBC_01481 TaxID=2975869 RepID=UPI00224F1A87|nr:antitoxin [Streptomyces sp. NBC_01481]MCX4587845.1 antitoxin [Streptomyces sp. NBC_01481]